MKREAKPKSALQYYADETRAVIRQMAARASNAIHYHISYQDLWDAMYSPDVQPMMKAMIPKLSGLGSSRINLIDGNGEACSIQTSIVRDSADTLRPLPVYPNYWEGRKCVELLGYITDINRQKRAVASQWDDVTNVFDTLNEHCRDANQMYSMWPPLLQIMEKGRLKYAIQSLGVYKHVRNPPDLHPDTYDRLRRSIPVVGMAMIMPDDIEPTNSPIIIG